MVKVANVKLHSGMSLGLADDKSTLVEVIAWCCQSTSHHLNPSRSIFMSSYCGTSNFSLPYVHNAVTSHECWGILTHWGRDKMAAFIQTTFCNAFPWMKIFVFWLKFQWSLFLGVQLIITELWFRKWLGAGQATSHYLNQWWPSLMTHVRFTWPQWVKSLETGLSLEKLVQADNEEIIKFLHCWLFVRGIHQSPWIALTKGQLYGSISPLVRYLHVLTHFINRAETSIWKTLCKTALTPLLCTGVTTVLQ